MHKAVPFKATKLMKRKAESDPYLLESRTVVQKPMTYVEKKVCIHVYIHARICIEQNRSGHRGHLWGMEMVGRRQTFHYVLF